MDQDQDSTLKLSASSENYVQPSLFGKTSQVPSAHMGDGTSERPLTHWPSQGRWTSHGLFWTHSGSAWRNGASVCSLSQILEDNVPQKYFLSPTAAKGILRRAEKRGRILPEQLRAALSQVATDTTPTEKT